VHSPNMLNALGVVSWLADCVQFSYKFKKSLKNSVTNPNLDLSDLYTFGPSGSGAGSISQKYGSRSFSPQAKIVRNRDFYYFIVSF
jgi:hypothetical protein